MKKVNLKIKSFLIIAFASLAIIPQKIFAQNAGGSSAGGSAGGSNAGSNAGGSSGAGTASGKPVDIGFQISSPIHAQNLMDFLHEILTIVIKIGIPVVTLFIIYTGFLFVTARGNAEKLTTAKSSLLWTCVGAALLFGSWVLAVAIQGTINQL